MIISITRIPQLDAVSIDPSLDETTITLLRAGPKGLQGDDGWTAALSVEPDGQRRVHQIYDWFGGEGTKPPVGKYVGATGLVDNIADAADIRGAAGRSVSGVSVNGAYHLIISYSDGTTADAGYVRGTEGPQGRSVTGATVDGAYHLILSYSDTTSSDAGYVRGPTGPPGSGSVNPFGSIVTNHVALFADGTGTVIKDGGLLGSAAFAATGDFAPIAHVGAGGNAHALVTTSVDGFMSATDKTKLNGIAAGATANTGTVTQVAVDVSGATGISVSGSPITTNGSFVFTWTTGYQAYSTAEATKLSGIASGADVTGTAIAAATAKTSLADADTMPLSDSAASNAIKKITWLNVKSAIWTALGALIAGGTAKATPVDADTLALSDSAASNATKKLTWAAVKSTLKTYFDTFYQPLNAKLSNIAGLSPATGDTIVWNGSAYVSQAAGGGSMTVLTGYVSTTSLSFATGEDVAFLDITIPIQTISKVMPFFIGGSSPTSSAAASEIKGTGNTINKVTPRLTSTTNLRLSVPGASGAAGDAIVGRYYLWISP